MPGDGEEEAWKEDADGDDDGTGEGLTIAAIAVSALESNKSRKDDQRGRKDVGDGDAIDEDVLGQPFSEQDRFDLDERNRGIRPAERQRAGDQAQDEQVDYRRRLGNPQRQRDGVGHAVICDHEAVTNIDEDEGHSGQCEKDATEPSGLHQECVDDAEDGE